MLCSMLLLLSLDMIIFLFCILIIIKPDFLSVFKKCSFEKNQEIRESNSKYIVVNGNPLYRKCYDYGLVFLLRTVDINIFFNKLIIKNSIKNNSSSYSFV